MGRLSLVVMCVATTAMAQPKPAPGTKTPSRAVPCAMDDPKLAVSATGPEPVVCWDKGCMKLEFSTTSATFAMRPPVAKDWMVPTAEVKDGEVCSGTTCKKLGKKLTAAIAEHKKDHGRPGVEDARLLATTDLKVVIVGWDKVWSVATDREMKFAAPKLYAKLGVAPRFMSAQPAGTLLVLSWTACAGPCTKYSLADSSGRVLGPEGEGGGPVFQLDAKRFVVASEFATLNFFELATGTPRGVVAGRGHAELNQIVRADDNTIFVMSPQNDGYLVSKVVAYDDKSLAPYVAGSMSLPKCNP